jgi:hypothetical protein
LLGRVSHGQAFNSITVREYYSVSAMK